VAFCHGQLSGAAGGARAHFIGGRFDGGRSGLSSRHQASRRVCYRGGRVFPAVNLALGSIATADIFANFDPDCWGWRTNVRWGPRADWPLLRHHQVPLRRLVLSTVRPPDRKRWPRSATPIPLKCWTITRFSPANCPCSSPTAPRTNSTWTQARGGKLHFPGQRTRPADHGRFAILKGRHNTATGRPQIPDADHRLAGACRSRRIARR